MTKPSSELPQSRNPRRRHAQIALLAVAVVVGLLWFAPRMQCAMGGGTWRRAGVLGRYQCVHTYADGDQPCQSSEQCMGFCVLNNPEQRAIGQCEKNDTGYGCYAVIEAPQWYHCTD